MSDDRTKKKLDSKIVSITEDYEVEYWTKRLDVTKERLKEVIQITGSHSAEIIKDYLGKK